MKTKKIIVALSALFFASSLVYTQSALSQKTPTSSKKTTSTGSTRGSSSRANDYKGIYRWVDENGVVTYADRVGADFKDEYTEFNARSWVKKSPSGASETTEELEKLLSSKESATPDSNANAKQSASKLAELDKAYKEEVTQFEKILSQNRDSIKQMRSEKERLEGLLRTVDNVSEYGRIRESINSLEEAIKKSEKVIVENEAILATRAKQYNDARTNMAGK